MSDIEAYLSHPIKKGVNYRLYQFDINTIIKIAKELDIDEWVENEDEENMFIDLYLDDDMFDSNIDEIIVSFYKDNMDKNFINFFNINKSEFDKKVDKEYEKYERDKLEIITELLYEDLYEIFESGVKESYKDSLCFNYIGDEISKLNNLKNIEVVSVNSNILNDFEKVLLKIPYMKDALKTMKKRVSHSSRYVYRPFHYSFMLWLKNLPASKIHKELKELLINGIIYHDREEWRTSVILCSIVTELILADIYEEQHKEEAPDIPLGALFDRVKTNPNMTSEISNAISGLNKIRISAVHRSKSPISDRDSELTFVHIFKIIKWYSENY